MVTPTLGLTDRTENAAVSFVASFLSLPFVPGANVTR